LSGTTISDIIFPQKNSTTTSYNHFSPRG